MEPTMSSMRLTCCGPNGRTYDKWATLVAAMSGGNLLQGRPRSGVGKHEGQ